RRRIRHGLGEVGRRAALRAVPADVLVTAFRDELDARSPIHRWIRRPFRGLTAVVGALGRRLRASLAPPGPDPHATDAAAATDAAVRDGARQLREALGPEVAAWRGDEATREALASAVGLPAMALLQTPGPLVEDVSLREDRAQLLARCRELIRGHLPGGLEEGAPQTPAPPVYIMRPGTAPGVTAASRAAGPAAAGRPAALLTT